MYGGTPKEKQQEAARGNRAHHNVDRRGTSDSCSVKWIESEGSEEKNIPHWLQWTSSREVK